MSMSKAYTFTSTGKEVGANGKRATSVLNIVIYLRIEIEGSIRHLFAGCFMAVIFLCSSVISFPNPHSKSVPLRQILPVSGIIHDVYIKFS